MTQHIEPVMWQKRHPLRTDNLWVNTHAADARWWRDNATGWEVREVYTAAQLQAAEQKGRREALEEAAKAVEDYAEGPYQPARAIRALTNKGGAK